MAPARTSLSAGQARRLALAAQGFTDPRPAGRVDRRHVRRLFDRVDVVQIDSVNVLVRSQELPLFARLGAHPRDLLPRMIGDAELFEYWCHEASLLPIDHFPLVRWRMGRSIDDMWASMRSISDDPGYLEAVYAEVRDRGPMTAGELSEPGAKTAGMWGWNKGKRALEHLFWSGAVTARRRPGDFARVYDLTERMIPTAVLARPAPAEDDAKRTLLDRAARAMGVATARDLADYHRLNLPKARPLVADLVEDGRLVPVTVEGWREPAYLHPAATRPRRVDARALLSPFDSLIWERSRTERLFGFHYRVEIYTPAAKRRFGYYVLPFLLGDRLVARVDLKADRQAKVLRVQGAHIEPGEDETSVAGPLAAELGAMAAWLALDGVAVADRGDLAPPLTRAVVAACA